MKQIVVFDPVTREILFVSAKGTAVTSTDATGDFNGDQLSNSSIPLLAGDIVIVGKALSDGPVPIAPVTRTYRVSVKSVSNGVGVLDRKITSESETLAFKVERHSGEASFTAGEKTAIMEQIKAETGLAEVDCLVASSSMLICPKLYKIDSNKKMEKKEEFAYE